LTSTTITDVAKRAGVSMKTVSRVMNAEPHVRDELRIRVLEAVKALRYRPKTSARSLAGARAYVLGFVLSDTTPAGTQATDLSPYATRAQLGALHACRKAGYHLLLEAVDPVASDPDAEFEFLSGILAVDGMILPPPHCDNEAILDALDREGIPYARIAPARDEGRSACVEVDDEAAAGTMTRLLLDLGHERIACIKGPDGHSASAKRLRGYRLALAERGVAASEALVRPGLFTFESGYEAATLLLATPQPPTAIFAANDLMALGVIARAQELGHQLPQTLSVAGFDDIPAASMFRPSLTTMRQPIAEMAAAATEMLIAGSGGEGRPDQYPHRRLDCELVIRGSTAPPR
jgi:LacI family transcriptional regulator